MRAWGPHGVVVGPHQGPGIGLQEGLGLVLTNTGYMLARVGKNPIPVP